MLVIAELVASRTKCSFKEKIHPAFSSYVFTALFTKPPASRFPAVP